MRTEQEIRYELNAMQSLAAIHADLGEQGERAAEDIMATLRWVLS